LFWFLAISFYFTEGTWKRGFSWIPLFLAIRIIAYDKPFPWKPLNSSPTILIRELRDEVSENFENLSEKTDLIQCTGGTPSRKQWTLSVQASERVPQQT
jgi:hypothetical protein